MGFDYEKVEKAWFKQKKTVLDELEEYTTKRIDYIYEHYSTSHEEKIINFKKAQIDAYKIILDKIQELKRSVDNK